MTALREVLADNGPMALTLGGLLIGFVFGVIVYRTNFCTMGAISDIVSFGDARRFRAWMLAAVTAILGTQLLDYAGVVELSRSMYLGASVNWAGSLLGGLMFGYGMVFAGGCASRNLVRVGGGDLRSLLALVVLGVFAYMTMGGIFGPARVWLEQSTALDLTDFQAASQGVDEVVRAHFNIDRNVAVLAALAAIVLPALLYCFSSSAFRASRVHTLSGIGVGLCVVAGWALTGLTFDEMSDRPVAPISLTYVRPTGDSLEWLQRYTALGWPGFGVATVFGAVIGAFVTALRMGRFKVTSFSDKKDTVRVLGGAALMGIGGVLGLGCTIGQGVTGLSTLAIGSFLTFSAIVVGGVIGIKVFERILMAEA